MKRLKGSPPPWLLGDDVSVVAGAVESAVADVVVSEVGMEIGKVVVVPGTLVSTWMLVAAVGVVDRSKVLLLRMI